MPVSIEDFWFTSADGLKLHALLTGWRSRERLPVICLPGISRTAEDFRTLLAAFFSNNRSAFALDSRGRGQSERDRNPANYSVPVELGDVIKLLNTLEIERAVLVGTSRGGILTMALASIMPQMIAGAVLNDVGPVLDMAGLMRIKGYVGKIAPPRSWHEAVASLKRVMGMQFPAFNEQDWEDYARRTWHDDFSPRSDPALAAAFCGIDATTPLPSLWPQFEALAKTAPVLVLRGEHSDLLSRETVAEMKARSEEVEAIEIAGQGHAPAIEDPETVAKILRFVESCDRQLP
jgi:pimeloyl-ACP methyl ester carboxylesterase